MSKRDITLLAIGMLAGFIFCRRPETANREETVYRRLDPIEFKQVKPAPVKVVYKDSIIYRDSIHREYEAVKVYEGVVMDNDTTGRALYSATVTNNALEDIKIDYTPVVVTKFIKPRRIAPVVRGGVNTLGLSEIGAGLRINKTTVAINAVKDLKTGGKGVGLSVSIEF